MSATITPDVKNVVTLRYYLKQNIDQTLNDLKDFTFNDVVFPDGEILKNVTFAQFQALVLSLQSKNNTNLNYENKN
jgi:hypothetical protein